MDLAFTDGEQAFRAELRDFLRDNLPADIARKVERGRPLERDDHVRWQKILDARGWAGNMWPREHGGTGWSATQRYLFEEECSRANAPMLLPFGLNMVGPVIYTFGTPEQRERFLPKILSGDELWCQGYSEPGSGSDLASLQTRAVRDGDHYVVNGTKTWTSLAHWADWIFCLVRTDTEAKAQEGITFLLIDMKSPGIEVKEITTIDGGHHVNMTYFTDVRVPVANRIGEENKGWTYAKFLLGNERTAIAEVGPSKQRLRLLKQIARDERMAGRSLIEDESFAGRIAGLEIDLMTLEMMVLRQLADEEAGKPVGPEASILKIRGSEIRQQIMELCVEAVGYYAAPYDPAQLDHRWNEAPIGPEVVPMADFLYSRATTIYGGTNEIQKGIVAKAVLGM